jgi:parallel beta-helix repeat protein
LKRFRIWLEVLTVLVLIVFISSCTRGFYSGTSSTATTDNTYTLKGVVIIPNNECFTDVCKNSSTADGEPLPNADILLKGSSGQILTGKTNCQGEYEISGLTGETYLLYANRGEVWVKKVISLNTSNGGETNSITTTQVILWEVVESLQPGLIPIKDLLISIPIETIAQDLLDAVKVALSDCRDAQKDSIVIQLAKNYVKIHFNIPITPSVIVDPTPTPTPTPTLYALTINYIYQGGGQAAPSHTDTLAEGAAYNVTSPTLAGFTPDQATVSGTMLANDVTVTVTYTQKHTLTMVVSQQGGGTTSPVVGDHQYDENTVVDISATPTDCCQFVNWTGEVADPNSAITTVTMDSDKTVTAHFTAKKAYNATTNTNYDTIQAAIDDAVNGQTIIVCPGTYYENLLINNKNITLKSSDSLNPTIIDGGNSGSVVQFTGGDTSTLQGFTIQNGSADNGGGIYVYESSPTIEKNKIMNNTSTYGGGISVESSYLNYTTTTITGNTISGNTATYGGGGIYAWDDCSAIISGNTISGNSAIGNGGGGGISMFNYANPDQTSIIENNTITGNTAAVGGGIRIDNRVFIITGNTIEYNTVNSVGGSGGGIFVGLSPYVSSSGEIINNVISYNEAIDSNGGGISVSGPGEPSLANLTINGNTISYNKVSGNNYGELWVNGGGIAVSAYCSPTITNNKIFYNTAGYFGGGIWVNSNSSLLPVSDWSTNDIPTQTGGELIPAEGITHTIAGNKLLGNLHGSGSPLAYTEGAHVFFQ